MISAGPTSGLSPSRHLLLNNCSEYLPAVRFGESATHLDECSHGCVGKDEITSTETVTGSDMEDTDSQQDFEEVRRFSNFIDFDGSQLISFEMLTPPSGLRGGDMEVRTLRPVKKMPNAEESPLTVKHRTRISQQSSCQVSNLV